MAATRGVGIKPRRGRAPGAVHGGVMRAGRTGCLAHDLEEQGKSRVDGARGLAAEE